MKRHTPIPASIEREPFDVVVLGAGINGTGIARDAAMRGLKVLLLEKEDIGHGTSSRSARMIHGGLRYLEHGDVGLVWECLEERTNLIRIAPHLVRPQPLVIPFYRPNKHRPWKIRLGLTILDCLAAVSRSWLGAHQTLGRSAALQRVPGLNPADLTGAGILCDAYAEYGERLYVENVLSAAAQGATIMTYAPVEQLLVENARVRGVRFRDGLGQRRYEVRAAVTVNAAGPWLDRVLQHGPPAKRLVGGSKGSFLVVDPFPGAPAEACFFEALKDQRQVVVLPWNGAYLIGTTDIRYDRDPDEASPGPSEIDYLLQEANRAFPRASLTQNSIRFSYAGVRPLPYQPEGEEGSITRKHIVYDHAPEVQGLISIVGGKFSTFRSLAEEAVDKIFSKLRRKRSPCRTNTVPLPGAAGAAVDFPQFCAEFRKAALLPAKSANRLLKIYGTRSAQVLAMAAEGGGELKEPFDPITGALGAEILLAFRHEFAQTLSDVLLRRTLVAYESGFDPVSAENAARLARKYLDWDAGRLEDELDFYWQYARRFRPRSVPAPASQTQRTP